jgi:hypothetical protein
LISSTSLLLLLDKRSLNPPNPAHFLYQILLKLPGNVYDEKKGILLFGFGNNEYKG